MVYGQNSPRSSVVARPKTAKGQSWIYEKADRHHHLTTREQHKTAVCCHFTVSRSEGRGIDHLRAHAHPRAAPTLLYGQGTQGCWLMYIVQVPNLCKVSVLSCFKEMYHLLWSNDEHREYLIISCCTTLLSAKVLGLFCISKFS